MWYTAVAYVSYSGSTAVHVCEECLEGLTRHIEQITSHQKPLREVVRTEGRSRQKGVKRKGGFTDEKKPANQYLVRIHSSPRHLSMLQVPRANVVGTGPVGEGRIGKEGCCSVTRNVYICMYLSGMYANFQAIFSV